MKRILFVSGFGPGMKARDLAYEFEKYGPLVRCDIPIPRSNGTPYAFIEFRSSRDAESAYRDMHERKINGYRIGVHWAKNPPNSSYRERWAGRDREPSPNSRRRSQSPRRDGRGAYRRRSRERSRERFGGSERRGRERDDRERGRDYDRERGRDAAPRAEEGRTRSRSPVDRRDDKERDYENSPERTRTPPPKGEEEDQVVENGHEPQLRAGTPRE